MDRETHDKQPLHTTHAEHVHSAPELDATFALPGLTVLVIVVAMLWARR
jgi:hypothetical protein